MSTLRMYYHTLLTDNGFRFPDSAYLFLPCSDCPQKSIQQINSYCISPPQLSVPSWISLLLFLIGFAFVVIYSNTKCSDCQPFKAINSKILEAKLLPPISIYYYFAVRTAPIFKVVLSLYGLTNRYTNPATKRNATIVPIPNVPAVIKVPIW